MLQSGYGQPSWFGFGFILDEAIDRNEFSLFLTRHGIENRPIVSGNIQPV